MKKGRKSSRKIHTRVFCCMLAAVFCFTGCSGNRREKDEEKKDGNGTSSLATTKFDGELERDVTLRILENDTAVEQGYFEELLNSFNEKYKEYNIVAVDAKADQYMDLANDGPYGYGPDVLYQANDMLMKYVEGKHILPLPVQEMECYDKIPKEAWDAYQTQIGGNTYYCGVPVNIQAPMLYYRKDMLPSDWETKWDENQNKVPDMVESMTALARYSKQIHEQDASKYGYMRSLYDPYFSCGYLFSFGGYIFGENNTNPKDIGFSAGEAEKGAFLIRQLATIMNEECIDDTVTQNSYSKIASGAYFATITTPDVYTLFIKELSAAYEKEGHSKEEAQKLAEENLVMTTVPAIPESGDLFDDKAALIPSKVMGGINGYAISAYTKAPKAALAFVEFAANYENILLRNKLLGIAPARSDAAASIGGLSELLFQNLSEGNIVIMPSIQEVAQIWTPANTFFSDIAKDAFRKEGEQKYATLEQIKQGLKEVDKQIYDAIYTLKE